MLVNFDRFNLADEANYKTGIAIETDEEATIAASKGEKPSQRYHLSGFFHSHIALGLIKKKNVQGFIKQIYEPLIGNGYIDKLLSDAYSSKVEAKYIPENIILKELDLLQKERG